MKTLMLMNMLLESAMETCPGILVSLQHALEASDDASKALESECSIDHERLLRIFVQKLWAFRPSSDGESKFHSSSGPAVSFGDTADAFVNEAVQSLELNQCGRISRSDFLSLALGRCEQEVLLHMYDLSRGLASALAPWLINEELQGVWHTAVVVNGREYYFGGDIYYDEPGKTGFGRPLKSVWLGRTLRHQEELHTFIVDELKPTFSREAYDVTSNNCNHFSDKLVMYLVGKHIPEEIIRQPELVMNTYVGQTLRPLMNRLFGVHLENDRDKVLTTSPPPPSSLPPLDSGNSIRRSAAATTDDHEAIVRL
jgi:hypothetical protein